MICQETGGGNRAGKMNMARYSQRRLKDNTNQLERCKKTPSTLEKGGFGEEWKNIRQLDKVSNKNILRTLTKARMC